MKRQFVLVAVAFASLIQSAVAQPPGIHLNPGEIYVPGSLRDQYGNPVEPTFYPPIRRPGDQAPAIDTGFQSGGIYVDPHTGQLIHRSDRFQRKQTAYDPNRHVVDPGSMRYIDEIQTDRHGIAWRVTGKTWRSFGQPHSELTRVRYQGNGGLLNRIEHQVETRDVEVVPHTHPVSGHQKTASPRQHSMPQTAPTNVMDYFD